MFAASSIYVCLRVLYFKYKIRSNEHGWDLHIVDRYASWMCCCMSGFVPWSEKGSKFILLICVQASIFFQSIQVSLLLVNKESQLYLHELDNHGEAVAFVCTCPIQILVWGVLILPGVFEILQHEPYITAQQVQEKVEEHILNVSLKEATEGARQSVNEASIKLKTDQTQISTTKDVKEDIVVHRA